MTFWSALGRPSTASTFFKRSSSSRHHSHSHGRTRASAPPPLAPAPAPTTHPSMPSPTTSSSIDDDDDDIVMDNDGQDTDDDAGETSPASACDTFSTDDTTASTSHTHTHITHSSASSVATSQPPSSTAASSATTLPLSPQPRPATGLAGGSRPGSSSSSSISSSSNYHPPKSKGRLGPAPAWPAAEPSPVFFEDDDIVAEGIDTILPHIDPGPPTKQRITASGATAARFSKPLPPISLHPAQQAIGTAALPRTLPSLTSVLPASILAAPHQQQQQQQHLHAHGLPLPAPIPASATAPTYTGELGALSPRSQAGPMLFLPSPAPPQSISQGALLPPSSSSSSSLTAPTPTPTPPTPPHARSSQQYADALVQSLAHVPLHAFEPIKTLGTGTFGRVLLVRLRGPAPAGSGTPSTATGGAASTSRSSQTNKDEGDASSSSSSSYFALKVLQKADIVRLKQVEHINNERDILSQVRHPFIVNLLRSYQDSKSVYMLMDFVPGGEIFSHLRRARRFSADVTRFYIASILLALDYLHSKGIIYRDLKPENLLLDEYGFLKIADFGFAKHVPDNRTWTLCGTPEYLAPEIIAGTGHGKAADYWSLGILMFECLAGFPPFYAPTPIGVYERILKGVFVFPAHMMADRDAAVPAPGTGTANGTGPSTSTSTSTATDPALARDLISALLTADRSRRLGNLVGGAHDVKTHPWFAGVSWAALEAKRVMPPIVPRLRGAGDASYFQSYPEGGEEGVPGMVGLEPVGTVDGYGYLFPRFR